MTQETIATLIASTTFFTIGEGVMSSAWEPTPDELQRLNAGATIYLHIMGTQHPPVALEVGEIPK